MVKGVNLYVENQTIIIIFCTFNIINFSVLLSNIDDDYANIFITLFYLFLSYLVYKEWKYTPVVAVIGYFVCVWLSSTFGIAWFGWFGLHIGLTILLIILFEMK